MYGLQDQNEEPSQTVSLRDYFAAHAMQGMSKVSNFRNFLKEATGNAKKQD
jgi:hypothetical protein